MSSVAGIPIHDHVYMSPIPLRQCPEPTASEKSGKQAVSGCVATHLWGFKSLCMLSLLKAFIAASHTLLRNDIS